MQHNHMIILFLFINTCTHYSHICFDSTGLNMCVITDTDVNTFVTILAICTLTYLRASFHIALFRQEKKTVSLYILTRGVPCLSCMSALLSSSSPANPHTDFFLHSPQVNHLGHQEVAQRWGFTSSQS